MSKKCPKCGAITADKFCGVCGARVHKSFRFLKIMGWIIGIITFFALVGHFTEENNVQDTEDYKDICYVKVNVANIRSGPGKDNKIITKVRRGDRIKAATTQDDWIKIKTSQGQEGWIHSSLISDSKPKITSKKKKSLPNDKLNASVNFDGINLVVKNNDNFAWTDFDIELNSGVIRGGYKIHVWKLPAGESYTYRINQFAKGDGTRFNIYTTKIQQIMIHARIKGKSKFWFGYP